MKISPVTESLALVPVPYGQLTAVHKRVMELAHSGDAQELARLIEVGAPWNFGVEGRFGDGTPMHVAVRAGNVDVVKLLLGLGMSPNARHPAIMEGDSPLLAAASDPKCAACFPALLEAGLDLNLGGRHGWRLIHLAAMFDNAALLDAVLGAGVDPNQLPAEGSGRRKNRCLRTALELASSSGYVQTVRRLIDAGADVDCVDVNRCTPLHSACRFEAPLEVVRALVDAGANIHELNGDGRTPLHEAMRGSNAPVILWLLELHGLQPGPKTVVNGRTLKQHYSGRAEELQRLLSFQASELIQEQFSGAESTAGERPAAQRRASLGL